jgi:hypothetical protein
LSSTEEYIIVVRGKVIAGGFRIELTGIGYIEIDR